MDRPPSAPTMSAACFARPSCARRSARSSGRTLDEAGFVAVQDAAIRDAIKLQQDVGLGVVTDGEFRRASYWSRFVERTEGLAVSDVTFHFRDKQGQTADLHRAAGHRQSGPAKAARGG